MAEEKAPSKISGWIKAVMTSIMGLLSGAVLMYVSPLVTNVIKPAKPVANFGQQVQGLTVTFQNRSTGASEGWWDFGDGSPLEPFAANQDKITHIYSRPITYNVKLSLHNFLGEENERVSTVSLGDGSDNGPVIEAFKVDTIKPDAPATFKVASQIKNAELCIWSLGSDRPMEVSTDNSTNQERYVTIKDAGFYTLKLVAYSGKHTVEKSETVFVDVGNSASPSALLQVTFQATHVDRLTKEVNLNAVFPSDRKEHFFPFTLTHTEPGYQIVDAKFARPVNDAAVKDPQLAISPDKSKVILNGELVKPGGIMAWQKNPVPVSWTPTVALTLEHRQDPVMKTMEPVVASLSVPGKTLLPMPKLSKRWESKGATINLELHDGATVVQKFYTLPANDVVRFKNHPYHFTATVGTDGVHLDLVDAQAKLQLIGN